MEGKPRLLELSQCPIPDLNANVMIVSGLPWYASEAQVAAYLASAYPDAQPLTTRLYDDPVNGVSRGHCFVEYAASCSSSASSSTAAGNEGGRNAGLTVDLRFVKEAVECTPFERVFLTAALYCLTSSRWDRGGRLPELPTDAPPQRKTQQVGFGEAGYIVRCGPALGLPNTVTAAGAGRLRALRKRMRAAAARRERSSSSSSGSNDEEQTALAK